MSRYLLPLFACPKEELLKLSPQHFYAPKQTDARAVTETFADHNQRVLSGEALAFERRIRDTHGKDRICEVRLARLPSAQGRLLRASFIDVTDRKILEEKLLFANTLLASEIESAPEAMLAIETEPSRASFNQKFVEMWDLADDIIRIGDPEVIIRAVLTKMKDPGKYLEETMRFRLNPEVPIHREIELKDGRILECHSGAMQSKPDKCLGRIYFFRDITEQKRSDISLREERDFNAALLESLPGVFVLIDKDGRYVRWNDNLPNLTGLSDQQLLGYDSLSLVPDCDREVVRLKIREVFAKGYGEVEFNVRTKDGGVKTFRWNGQRIASEGRQYLLAIGADITEARQAALRLRASEERFRTIFNSVNDGILVCDASTEEFIDANQRACDMFGYPLGEVLGKKIDYLSSGVSPYTQSAASEWIRKARSDGPQILEWCCKHRNGNLFWVEISIRMAAFGAGEVVLATIRDVTERKRTQEQLTHLARHDGLTGLPNRAVFLEAMQQAIARAHRDGKGFAVLCLDLDHFKDVNDTLGHPVGDLLLQAVAERLLASVREVDTAARFGGDEFAVIQADIREPEDAATLAEKLSKAISEPFVIQGDEIRTGTSVGIAVYGSDSPDAETLLSHADIALYRAKADGRGTYRFFTDSMDTEVHTRVNVSTELREAIASGQLFLMYQPQVDVNTGRIVGLEALARWQHPQRGVVAPGEFISVAERSGLIIALERWVIREACDQAKRWLDAGIDLPLIAVNISVVQFKTPFEIENDIASILAESGLPPHLLELELTEGVLMQASHEYNDALLRLRRMGLRIAIDDFGNGYSSLDYLRRFSVDRIKIAQNFIVDLPTSPGNRAIVRAAIGLARELGIQVVVEGVETAAQLELLKSWGCQNVQGYYFAKPLLATDVTALLRRGKIAPIYADALEVTAPA